MHISTLIFFVLLVFFTWRGYQKGFIKSITRILSWIVAYPAAIFFTRPFGQWLIANTALDGVLVYFVAGSTIFLVVSFVVTIALNFLSKLIPNNSVTDLGSKIGGAGVGAVVGALAGLILVYGLGLLINFQSTKSAVVSNHDSLATEQVTLEDVPSSKTKVPLVKDLNETRDSFIEASAKKLVGNAAAAAVDLALEDKAATQVTRAFVQDPQSMLTHVQKVSQDGQLQKLMADEKIQSILITGDTHALMRDPAFNELMNNPSVKALMLQSDVDGELAQKAAAEKMVMAWNRVQSLKHDPRIIAIINDPEFQQQLNSPNKLPLMMNPKLNRLTEIIFNDKSIPANGMGAYTVEELGDDGSTSTRERIAPGDSNNGEKKTSTTIYRWTDGNGQVHYSDTPQKNNQ